MIKKNRLGSGKSRFLFPWLRELQSKNNCNRVSLKTMSGVAMDSIMIFLESVVLSKELFHVDSCFLYCMVKNHTGYVIHTSIVLSGQDTIVQLSTQRMVLTTFLIQPLPHLSCHSFLLIQTPRSLLFTHPLYIVPAHQLPALMHTWK